MSGLQVHSRFEEGVNPQIAAPIKDLLDPRTYARDRHWSYLTTLGQNVEVSPRASARASRADVKHGIEARTFPTPTCPMPAFLCMTAVVINGAIPVETTFRISVPTGTPLKSQFGIGMFGFLATTI